MLDIFSGLRLVVKRRSINIDNAIFRCHWFFTSTLLISFSLIITARQYVGQPIECHSVDKIPDSLLNSYCWVQSTFTVPQACNNQVYGVDVPYPCIDNTRGREVKIYAYYQWVGIVLFVQGLLFHLPYYLWKLWENGLIKAITGGLRVAVLNEQERAKKKEIVVEYIHDHLGCHKRYALKYFLCEFICLINLMAQLWATNKFFDGQFLRYGLEVLEYSSISISSQFDPMQTISSNINSNEPSIFIDNRTQSTLTYMRQQTLPARSSTARTNGRQPIKQQVDPMTYIFPRMTKCTYFDFGSSGDVQRHDALCLLPLNIINEKIYIALWFWFIVLAILTLLVIIYRIFAIVSENVRCKGLLSRCKLSSERDIRLICRHCDVGDWFLFYMVAENLDPLIMREIVASIATKINEHIELKNELKTQLKQQQEIEDLENEKFRTILNEQYRQHVADYNNSKNSDSNNAYSKHNSNSDQEPIVKKIKKRLYNKRLWSIDLGPSELRQQLFGLGVSVTSRHQEVSNRSYNSVVDHMSNRGNNSNSMTIASNFASAPPASEMPLNSAPPLSCSERRGSLTRKTSSSSGVSSSGSESFIMEMSTISGSTSCLEESGRVQVEPARWRNVQHLHKN